MAIEREVKVLNIDENIEELLKKKGCKFAKDEKQQNIIYKGFGATVKLRHTISLVDETETFEMIRKLDTKETSKSKYKVKDELSKMLSKEYFEEVQDMLKFMGYEEVLNGIKMRRSYTLGDFLYEIDTWEKEIFPMPYLEIEAQKKKAKLSEGLEQIFTKKEIKKLILSKDGITDLKDMYQKSMNKIYKVLYEKISDKKK